MVELIVAEALPLQPIRSHLVALDLLGDVDRWPNGSRVAPGAHCRAEVTLGSREDRRRRAYKLDLAGRFTLEQPAVFVRCAGAQITEMIAGVGTADAATVSVGTGVDLATNGPGTVVDTAAGV